MQMFCKCFTNIFAPLTKVKLEGFKNSSEFFFPIFTHFSLLSLYLIQFTLYSIFIFLLQLRIGRNEMLSYAVPLVFGTLLDLLQRIAQSAPTSFWITFSPTIPVDAFTFANRQRWCKRREERDAFTFPVDAFTFANRQRWFLLAFSTVSG